jgi:hypothetical protein
MLEGEALWWAPRQPSIGDGLVLGFRVRGTRRGPESRDREISGQGSSVRLRLTIGSLPGSALPNIGRSADASSARGHCIYDPAGFAP